MSNRAPIVGVWVSGRPSVGGGGAGPTKTRGQLGGPPPPPLDHPYTYPACLHFLLGRRGGGGARASSRPAAAAGPAAFLVLRIPGGINGGAPAFFEACALPNGDGDGDRSDGDGSDAEAAAAAGRGLHACRVGRFEQLDFAADVDVTVGGREGGRGGEGGRRRGGGGGGGANADRAVVIGRLRRVSNPSFAEPFRRAQEGTKR